MAPTRILALLAGLALTSACARCTRDRPSASDTGAAATFEVASPPTLRAPEWKALPSTEGIGLPTGCRFDPPVRRATLPEGKLRFATGRHSLGSLVVALGKDDLVETAGFLSLATHEVTPVAWGSFAAPPLFEKTKSGWFTAWIAGADPARALGWTGGERATVLAEGDALALADVACDGDRCVALTSLARTTRTGGATLVGTDGQTCGDRRPT
jgi:hypothetical protein